MEFDSGGFDTEYGAGQAAAGDWTEKSYIEAVAASTGKPYMARIVGRDATYSWKRTWLKPRWEYPSRNANPTATVRLVLPVVDVGTLPAAIEVRWGPATGYTECAIWEPDVRHQKILHSVRGPR